MFAAGFPLAPLLAFLENLTEIRFDAKKYLVGFRRPPPDRAEDIGTFLSLLEVLSIFAVMTNCAIIAFTSNYLSYMSPGNRVLFIVVVEHLFIVFKMVLRWAIPDVSEEVRLVQLKQELQCKTRDPVANRRHRREHYPDVYDADGDDPSMFVHAQDCELLRMFTNKSALVYLVRRDGAIYIDNSPFMGQIGAKLHASQVTWSSENPAPDIGDDDEMMLIASCTPQRVVVSDGHSFVNPVAVQLDAPAVTEEAPPV